MLDDTIRVRGARQHNLKNIDVDIPRGRLVVITGLSGSGKSTLAFDTIFAEGQRRYVESLSAYARQFLGQLDKPDVDSIDGLSPAIAIDQTGHNRNPRSTVGTITEIYDYLRLLFARVGQPHCPIDGQLLQRQSAQQIVDALLSLPDGTRLLLLAPVVRERKGEHQRIIDEARRAGFVRVRVDGQVYDLDERIPLEKHKAHTIEVVVDRLVIRHSEISDKAASKAEALPRPSGDSMQLSEANTSAQQAQIPILEQHPDRVRIADSVDTALKVGMGMLHVQIVGGTELSFSQQYACPTHGPINLGALEPRDFSFNNPSGACPGCNGLGIVQEVDPERVIPDMSLSLAEGAVLPWSQASRTQRRIYDKQLAALAAHMGFSLESPLRALPAEALSAVLYGSSGEPIPSESASQEQPFEGVIPSLRRRISAGLSDDERSILEPFLSPQPCPSCKGMRLRPEVLAVTVDSYSIAQIAAMPIAEAFAWASREAVSFSSLPTLTSTTESASAHPPLSSRSSLAHTIATPILKEIRARLSFLIDVGLSYLTLDRSSNTLSGGEAQRIRLATQIGSGLSGVLYILDEPSIGLHPRDHARLMQTIKHLRDVGNSVLLVEHDEDSMRAADWLIDIGPRAGVHGGELIASGSIADIMATPASITGQFLSGKRRIAIPKRRRSGSGRKLVIKGAREHNLKNIDVSIPLGTFTVITGVSGSGKSSLINDTLYARLSQQLYNARGRPGAHDTILGIEHIDKVIAIDQAAIGRTPRSNPATYTKLFDPLRSLFAQVNEAKVRGYDAGRFSFNVAGGRCEHCNGEGLMQIEMQFLPDLYVVCEVCNGARYNRETLDIRYRGKNIAEVLSMTVEDALAFFERIPNIREKLQALSDVGLGYMQLDQAATTLSGGEAQRIKLASELARRSTGRTLYILDEPTTGLHFADVEQLLAVLQRLVDAGNTVLVIEHNLDIIKSADWLIDMGPEGGDAGGFIVGVGTPEQLAQNADSYTGQYLNKMLLPMR